MSEVQAPYGVTDAHQPHPLIVSVVGRSTVTKAVKFDGSEESLQAIDLLTHQHQYANQKYHADMMGFFWLTPRHQVKVGDYVAMPRPGHAHIISAAEIQTTYCVDGQLNFSQAVQLLLDGKSMSRLEWKQRSPDYNYTLFLSAKYPGKLFCERSDGEIYPYCLEDSDLVANDWHVVDLLHTSATTNHE